MFTAFFCFILMGKFSLIFGCCCCLDLTCLILCIKINVFYYFGGYIGPWQHFWCTYVQLIVHIIFCIQVTCCLIPIYQMKLVSTGGKSFFRLKNARPSFIKDPRITLYIIGTHVDNSELVDINHSKKYDQKYLLQIKTYFPI